jgi:hypothetical protein
MTCLGSAAKAFTQAKECIKQQVIAAAEQMRWTKVITRLSPPRRQCRGRADSNPAFLSVAPMRIARFIGLRAPIIPDSTFEVRLGD